MAIICERKNYNIMRKKSLTHDTLKKYFPKSFTAKQMEKVIIKLLDNWLKHRQMAKDK